MKNQTFTDEQLKEIHSADTWQDASSIIGNIVGNGHHGKIAYIKQFKGSRAVGGFFQTTRANVKAKFATVWSENTGK